MNVKCIVYEKRGGWGWVGVRGGGGAVLYFFIALYNFFRYDF